MALGAYYVVTRSRSYGLPLSESIHSIRDLCDEIRVLVDPRFDDGTLESLKELDAGHLNVVEYELPLDNPLCVATAKNYARSLCESPWLLEMEPTDVIDERYHEELLSLIDGLDAGPVNLIAIGNLPLFNGRYVKLSAPLEVTKITRNGNDIAHGVPKSDRKMMTDGGYCSKTGNNGGCGYIRSTTGKELGPNYLAYLDIENDTIDLDNGVWNYDLYWYSLPTAWDRKIENTYYQMLLTGEVLCEEDYYVLPDGEEVDFWEPPNLRAAREFSLAIREEMEDESIRSIQIELPDYLNDWLRSQRVVNPKSAPPELVVKPRDTFWNRVKTKIGDAK